jgi:hypothetical protein
LGSTASAYGQHEDRTPTHGYEATSEAAMKAFALPFFDLAVD